MKNIRVNVPIDVEDQRKIASVLDRIDSKIEQNTNINKNLAA